MVDRRPGESTCLTTHLLLPGHAARRVVSAHGHDGQHQAEHRIDCRIPPQSFDKELRARVGLRGIGSSEMDVVWVVLESLRRWLAAAGTYLIIEMVLPGGTLLALLLYLYRRRQSRADRLSIRDKLLLPGCANS